MDTKQERNRDCLDREVGRAIERAVKKDVSRSDILNILSRWQEHAASLCREETMRLADR